MPKKTKSSWISASKKPMTTDCVAVIVDTCKYPTIGWYSKHNGEWVLEDKDIKGYVIAWYPLPNYQTFKKHQDGN